MTRRKIKEQPEVYFIWAAALTHKVGFVQKRERERKGRVCACVSRFNSVCVRDRTRLFFK